ncbi:outer membrane beta-barrel protein [Leptothrix discophora]|uniref:Outer membrane beta-barrel protein n=1 Tax=Leptothrix discophora TaxID=89 RepID=A0ABT9G1Y2_LEPDI|nr:outer membrane beta-barrel protein [Leptothrix discophora]MDP4300499.1 outer membrane beta-barrel protein [Leptothrix discophora]
MTRQSASISRISRFTRTTPITRQLAHLATTVAVVSAACALFGTDVHAQQVSDPYVTAGYASFEGYSGGLYVGGGLKLGSLNSLFKLNLPGDLNVEGRYASASTSSYGVTSKATSFEGVAVASHPFTPQFSVSAYAGIGSLKADATASYAGYTASVSASTTELIGGVGVQYEVIPRLKLEARLGLLGYGSTTTFGAQYRF